MPSVLDRDSLDQSPLADLHLIANELGVDGFRRLRKPDLIDAIIDRQSGGDTGVAEEEEPAPKPRRRSRAKAVAEPLEAEVETEAEAEVEAEVEEEGATDEDAPARGRRGRRGGRGRGRREEAEDAGREPAAEDRVAEGVVELLGNG